ncbi:Hypothetical protein GLP15_3382 [Giardia lamblia P15]|uniref:Uncharacterized protein n=1 Tax=Giardia intestinalis (strain P15) TaxID=658858 RepID=E1EVX8_GIAIA|nr:Hypothetical protein GLP15_3382 [Giardia lamblia P15]
MLLGVFFACALGFQLRAECHVFHFSQGVRVSVLRQEPQDVSKIELQCIVVTRPLDCDCLITYIGDAGKESIWLLTLDPVKQCNVSSEIIVSAVHRQIHGVSSREVRLQMTSGAVSGYCGMYLDWMRPNLTFFTPSHSAQIHLSSQSYKLTTLNVARTRPSALCPGNTLLQLHDRVKDSTQRSHATLVQEIEAVVRRVGELASPNAKHILLATTNEYMSIRAATLNVFARLVCQGLSVKHQQNSNVLLMSLSLTTSSINGLTRMLMRLLLGLLHNLSLSDESRANRISEVLFGLDISKLRNLIEQRAATCFLHGIWTLHEYTYLEPDLSGFIHCLLQSDFVPSVELVANKHGIDLVKAINILRKQQTIVYLSPKDLDIASPRVLSYFWKWGRPTCFLVCLCGLVLIILVYFVYLKWPIIKHLIFAKRSRFKLEKVSMHTKAHEMV